MPLTLGDIGRWDASAIRDVSTALAKRGASAEDVDLPRRSSLVITSWSPVRLAMSKALDSSGRRASLRDAMSTKISSHPTATRASRWDSGC